MLPGSITRTNDATDAGERSGWLDEVGPSIGEAILEVGDESVGLVEDTLGTHRRVWQDDTVDHARIELRGVSAPEYRSLRRALRRAIERVVTSRATRPA